MGEEDDRRRGILGLSTGEARTTHAPRTDRQNVEAVGCLSPSGQGQSPQSGRGGVTENLIVIEHGQQRGATVNEVGEVDPAGPYAVVRTGKVAPTHPSVGNAR